MTDSGFHEPSGQNLRIFGCYSLAVLVMVLLLILNVMPVQLPSFGVIRPPILLMAVYFWSIFRPSFLPPVSAFLLGLLLDVFTGGPFGLNALIFVGVRFFAENQRRLLTGRSFWLVWWGYVFVGMAAGAVSWVLASVLSLYLIPATPVLISTAFGISLFPLFVLPLFSTHKALLSLNTL